jgi:hypothetical protein
MSVKLQRATVAKGTSHRAEERIKRNISVSVEIQQAAAMMGTGHGAEVCRKRDVSVSFELQQAAVTLMETLCPAEVCVKRSTRDEARDHLLQHFSQGSGVSHITLFLNKLKGMAGGCILVKCS